MGGAISTTVDGLFFPRKSDLTKFLQAMVNRYNVGDYLNPEDVRFCLSLFESHSDYPQKLAPGVNSIQILIQEKGTRGFQLHKIDGTSDNISWTNCVSNRK